MSRDRPAFIWTFNKASIFIEAMELASDRKQGGARPSAPTNLDQPSRWRHAQIGERPVPGTPSHWATPRLAALTVCLVVLTGIAVFT